MKDIKDYLHLYLGCEVVTLEENYNFPDLKLDCVSGLHCKLGSESRNLYWKVWPNQFKLLLRPLSDISDEERVEYKKTKKYYSQDCPESFRYLLSKGFDLFGLIEAGLAVDSTRRVLS